MSRTLPPGLSQEDFDSALKEFADVVGEKWLISDDSELVHYDDPYPVGEHVAAGPSAVISPASTEEVQAIVRIANKYGVPLSPVSTGKNNGYGGAAPRLTGAVVVNTGAQMNKIIEVDEKYGYALVEPGVTYFDLAEYLAEHAPTLMIDCPDLGWGSVVGNTLDRGVGYTPYGDHYMWQTGMEVVLPQGEVMRTGMGAVPGSNTWQLFQYGFGPVPDGMFTQSNLGIVTKMGIALMQRAPRMVTYLVAFENESDLPAIVDTMLPLRINMAPIQNVPVIRNIIMDAAAVSKRTDWYAGEGPLPAEAVRKMQDDLNLGYWNFYGTVYGPPPIVDMYLQIIEQAFTQIPGAKFFTNETRNDPADLGAHTLRDRHKINTGTPSLDELALLDFVPNGGHICFSPVSAPDGADAMRQAEMVKARADEYVKDYAAQFIIGLREMHHICLFPYDTKDPQAREDTLEMTRQLVKEAAAVGYGEYRTHNALMDEVMATYNWGDGALLKFHEAVKDALDPNGIIAPGKSGVWPAKYRGQNL